MGTYFSLLFKLVYKTSLKVISIFYRDNTWTNYYVYYSTINTIIII